MMPVARMIIIYKRKNNFNLKCKFSIYTISLLFGSSLY